MLAHVLHSIHDLADAAVRALRRRLGNALRPAATNSLVLGAVADLVRGKTELVAENALLRQQLIVLARSTRRPRLAWSDRALLVLLASRVGAWRSAVLIVQPATLLRWHRAGFRIFWRWRSTPRTRHPRVSQQTVDLIRRLARENRLRDLWRRPPDQSDPRTAGLRACPQICRLARVGASGATGAGRA